MLIRIYSSAHIYIFKNTAKNDFSPELIEFQWWLMLRTYKNKNKKIKKPTYSVKSLNFDRWTAFNIFCKKKTMYDVK